MVWPVHTVNTISFLVSTLSVEWIPNGRRLFDYLFSQKKKKKKPGRTLVYRKTAGGNKTF